MHSRASAAMTMSSANNGGGGGEPPSGGGASSLRKQAQGGGGGGGLSSSYSYPTAMNNTNKFASSAAAPTAARSNAAASARARTMPIIVHYVVRPHLPPCYSDVAIVPIEARSEDITLCAANTFFSYCEAQGDSLGALPSSQISDYGLFLLKPPPTTTTNIGGGGNNGAVSTSNAPPSQQTVQASYGNNNASSSSSSSSPLCCLGVAAACMGVGPGNMSLRCIEINKLAAACSEGETIDNLAAYGCQGDYPELMDDAERRDGEAPFHSRHNPRNDKEEMALRQQNNNTIADNSYHQHDHDPTFDNARRPTTIPDGPPLAAPSSLSLTGGGDGGINARPFSPTQRSNIGLNDDTLAREFPNTATTDHFVTLPPLPPHLWTQSLFPLSPSADVSGGGGGYDRTELGILLTDFEQCQPKAMLLRFIQTVMEKRQAQITSGSSGGGGSGVNTTAAAGGGGSSGNTNTTSNGSQQKSAALMNTEDPTIIAAKVKARVESLYQYNRNAAEDAVAEANDVEASCLHEAVIAQMRPTEVYFCLNRAFLEREEHVAAEEEQRGAIELIMANSWDKLLAYAALWHTRSLAAQHFRESNAASRNRLLQCETRVRDKLLAREHSEWVAKHTVFTDRFAELEMGMLAQFHLMRKLRAQHRSEIDAKLIEEGLMDAGEGEGEGGVGGRVRVAVAKNPMTNRPTKK